jgi:hypothetical protein
MAPWAFAAVATTSNAQIISNNFLVMVIVYSLNAIAVATSIRSTARRIPSERC